LLSHQEPASDAATAAVAAAAANGASRPMSVDLPPPAVFWDIVDGKMRLVDGLQPGAKTFLDVAEAWRWSKKVADQELWLEMAKVRLFIRLSSKYTTIGVPVSWSYYGDLSWAQRHQKVMESGVGYFPRGDEDLRGRINNFLVFQTYSQTITEFYEKKEKIAEVAFYAITRKEKKVMPGFVLKSAFITDRTLRPAYNSWDFEIMADEAWHTDTV
jgi:hypothetical protein